MRTTCDLKPANVLIRPGEIPVLVDFGLSTALGAVRERLQVQGTIVGTAAYMSPEQARGELSDARGDLYALGCILYELLTGRPPFLAASPLQVLHMHEAEEAAPPSAFAPEIPPEIDDLVLRLLAKSPRDRPGFADDVAARLERLGVHDSGSSAGPRPRAYLYRPALAGREGVAWSLDRDIERTVSSSGQLLLVGGENGVGKTRLCNEVAGLARARGIDVLMGECLQGGTPFEGLRGPLRSIGDLCRQKGLEASEEILGGRAKLLALYEPSLRPLARDDEPEPGPLPVEDARLRLFTSLAQTFQALASKNAWLLLLDDLQWGDDLMLGFLGYLLRGRWLERMKLVVLGAYRPEDASQDLRNLASHAGTRTVGLERLDEPAVGEMVSGMLALRPVPPLFARYLTRQSEGNPLFVAEYLRAAITEGILVRDGEGHWQVGHGASQSLEAYESLPLPATIQELVERRLSRLSEGASSLLAAAAVLGRDVDVALLQETCGLSDRLTATALAELVTRQVLEFGVRFVHGKIRDVAYARLLPEERERAWRGPRNRDPGFSGHRGRKRRARIAYKRRSRGWMTSGIPVLQALQGAAQQGVAPTPPRC